MGMKMKLQIPIPKWQRAKPVSSAGLLFGDFAIWNLNILLSHRTFFYFCSGF